jgi:hypothetical protein
MATLKTFTVDSFNKNFNFLEWEFNEPVPTGNKVIEIYRSESPGDTLSGFDLVETVDVTDGSYVDDGIENLYQHNRKWYYYLNLVDNDTTEETLLPAQPVTGYDSPMDYAAREILYRKDLSLKRFTQRTFYLLKRRTWGTHCSVCWDETLFRATDPNCTTCYGTGWEIGYFNPVRFQCMVTPSPSYNQLLPFAKWKPSDILLTMLNFPNIVEEDVIVDDKGDRWIVVQKRSVEKLGRVIEQSVQMSKIMPDDIVYTVPVTISNFNDVITFFDDPTINNNITYPTYLTPTLTLSDGGETDIMVESGTSIDSASLTPIWTQNDAGLVTSYTLYKNSGMVVSSGVGFEYNVPTFNIGVETVTYYSVVEYEEGAIKNDSEGDPYPVGRISEGTIQSNNVIYRGVRAAFAGVDGSTIDIRSLSSNILNPETNSSITLSGVTGDTAIFAYPATLRNLTGATFYSGGFTFNILSEVVRQADQAVNDASGGNPITYKVYKYDPVANFINVDITFTI